MRWGGRLKHIIENEVPFTFFCEIYSDIYEQEEYKELLRLCSSHNNEAGLHCHGFSLSDNILDELSLNFYDYTTEYGFDKIIEMGVNKYKSALGYSPFSYRAGSFEVFDGYFHVLNQHGLKVDSSIYYNSTFDYRSHRNEITNCYEYIDGIMELPVTTYYDIEKKGSVGKFDLNTTSFAKKLELIVRNILSNSKYIMMLCHSWSFSDYKLYDNISKKYHTKFSQNSYDEVMYIIDFINKTETCEFITCRDFYKKIHNTGKPVELIGYAKEKVLDIPVECCMSLTLNINLVIDEKKCRMIIKKIQDGNDYIQFFDGKFLCGSSKKYADKCNLPLCKSAVVKFNIIGKYKQDASLFFMTYNAESGNRISSFSSKFTIYTFKNNNVMYFDVPPEAKTFKIAIKIHNNLDYNVMELSEVQLICYS